MTLISLDHHKRLKNKKDLKNKTNVLMNLKQVNHSNKIKEVSNESFNDNYMKDALGKVRKSETIIDVDYARFHGTSLYTESVGREKLDKELEELEKEVLSQLDDAEEEFVVIDRTDIFDRENYTPPDENEAVKKQPKSLNKQNEEVSWKRICEQLGHKQLGENRPTSFFGQLRESLQTKQHNTLLNLKRSSRT